MKIEGLRLCDDDELINMYKDGDELAFEILVERYKYIVQMKTKAMFLAGGDSDDIFQEGMIGLFKAVKDYNPEKNASFSTFASMCINRNMITAVTASKRKKYSPLNSYVSYDTSSVNISSKNNRDSNLKLVDILEPEIEQNPETILIDREYLKSLKNDLLEMLSPMEKKVFDMYLVGDDYAEIANKLNKQPKAIDNALQRIKSKAGKLLLTKYE